MFIGYHELAQNINRYPTSLIVQAAVVFVVSSTGVNVLKIDEGKVVL